MRKKLILLDLDGTILDHSTNNIPFSTKKAIKLLQMKGHYVAIATGRTPSLFYGMDKELNIDMYIAANGRYVQYFDETLYHDSIDSKVVKRFVTDMELRGIDIAFETVDAYVINQKTSDLADKFSDYFHMERPNVSKNFHLKNDVLQMVMFYTQNNYDDFQSLYPELEFNFSSPFGVDVNTKGGMKEVGMEILMNRLNISIEDTIAFGDGYNDIGMIKLANIGIAMGNACDDLKNIADRVTDSCSNDGIWNALNTLKLI